MKDKYPANINFDKSEYFALEYIAEQEGKSVTQYIRGICNSAINAFRNEHNLSRVPMTSMRKAKNKNK